MPVLPVKCESAVPPGPYPVTVDLVLNVAPPSTERNPAEQVVNEPRFNVELVPICNVLATATAALKVTPAALLIVRFATLAGNPAVT